MRMRMKQAVENWSRSFGKTGPAEDGQVRINPKRLTFWTDPIHPDRNGALR